MTEIDLIVELVVERKRFQPTYRLFGKVINNKLQSLVSGDFRLLCLVYLTILIAPDGKNAVLSEELIGCFWGNRAIQRITEIEHLLDTESFGIVDNSL